jgi:hypothetical protein
VKLDEGKTVKEEEIQIPHMDGQPSIDFIRKIYNIITYKQEQLEEIKKIEQKVMI